MFIETIKLEDSNIFFVFSKTIKFKESGDYWLFSDGLYNNSGTCDIVIANDPMPAEMREFTVKHLISAVSNFRGMTKMIHWRS